MLLDLELVKLHLRVDDTAEDDLIKAYIQAAEDNAAAFLNRAIYATQTDKSGDDKGIVATPAIKQALMVMVGTKYALREDVTMGAKMDVTPRTAEDLLWPYRCHVGV